MEASAPEVKKPASRKKPPTQSDLAPPVTALALPERAAVALGSAKTEADLLALVEKSKDILLVNSKDGREQAHRMAMDLQTARTTITKTGKLAREDATAFSAAVLAEERRLIAITDAEEKRVFKLRDDFDAIEKAKKEEADRIERERVATINARVQEIRQAPFEVIGMASAAILGRLDALRALVISEELFGELIFHGQATAAKADSIRALETAHAAALASEQAAAELVRQAEANRIAAEKLEAERIRMAKEQAERDAEIARQAQALADERAAHEARIAAEQAATKKEQKEAAEKLAAAQQALDLRTAELDKAEADRVERERLAALPPEVVAEVPKTEEAPPAPDAAGIFAIDGYQPPATIPEQAPAEVYVAELALSASFPQPVNDLAQVEAFRAAAVELLLTRTATEVIEILSDVIDVQEA